MFGWIKNNVAILGLMVSVWALVVPAWRYIDARAREQRQRDYVNYHKLISELVDPLHHGTSGMLDSQIAVVYELQFYPRYGDLTKRMFKRLLEKWKDEEKPLLDEMALTIEKLGG